jgi:hypothetical protein
MGNPVENNPPSFDNDSGSDPDTPGTLVQPFVFYARAPAFRPDEEPVFYGFSSYTVNGIEGPRTYFSEESRLIIELQEAISRNARPQ